VGVAHTRWATHGRPSEENAHPHRSGPFALVHNGIIENYAVLKEELESKGHVFSSQTDTEVIVKLLDFEWQRTGDYSEAVRRTLKKLKGSYAVVIVNEEEPDRLVAAKKESPLILGLADDAFYLASDVPAILSHTRDVVFLGDEEMAVVTRTGVSFTDFFGRPVSTATQRVLWDPIMAEKGGYKHFMLKEIFEQPTAARDTILGRVSLDRGQIFLEDLNIPEEMFRTLQKVTIIACGTSWHAALVGKYLIEALAQVPVEVDYGSEYRYRNPIVASNELAIVITQSGETADTLAALREAKKKGARSIAICNVVGSMATREAQGTVYTHAGPEIGVASTKAFTSQLIALQLLALYMAQVRGTLTPPQIRDHITELLQMPQTLELALKASASLDKVAERFYNRTDFLFLGRGINYPIALEGALKLKEISYIHAEGYPAGELKHGPLALVDADMPVITVAPNNDLLEKLKSNLMEVRARGGELIVFADPDSGFVSSDGVTVIQMPKHVSYFQAPAVYTVPLQLLAYHVAILKGTDVDQPRNLAKSVTVE
jgi:glucosamine--fructose-6-phosphate aminotransferase (isomerizing)